MDFEYFIFSLQTAIGLSIGIYILSYPRISPTKLVVFGLSLLTSFNLSWHIASSYLVTAVLIGNVMASLIGNAILLAFLSKKIYFAIFLPIAYIINFLVVNSVMLLISFVGNISVEVAGSDPIVVTVSNIFITLPITFAIQYLIRRPLQKHLIPILEGIPRFIQLMISMLLLFFACLLYGIASLTGLELPAIQYVPFIILYIGIALIIVVIVLGILFSAHKHYERQRRMEYLENLNTYTQDLEHLYHDLRAFKHDYVNVMTSLSSYIEEKQYEELEVYFHKHILPMQQNLVDKTGVFNNLLRIHVLEIKSIIYSKLLLAVHQKIEITIDIPSPIDSIPVDSIDLIRILGILFDNAIEAALETEHPIVNVHIGEMEHSLVIIIANNFVDHGLSVSQMQQEHVTTKGDGHGIGLYHLKTMIDRHDNVFCQTYLSEGLFYQELQISK